jgi:hypothetical protein
MGDDGKHAGAVQLGRVLIIVGQHVVALFAKENRKGRHPTKDEENPPIVDEPMAALTQNIVAAGQGEPGHH